MSRQRRMLVARPVLMALTASFAVSVAVFNATYAAQAKVDAQLTNGADVTVDDHGVAGLPAGLTQVAETPRGRRRPPMQHRFAYVGNDLQDLYGIDPATIGARRRCRTRSSVAARGHVARHARGATRRRARLRRDSARLPVDAGDTCGSACSSRRTTRYHMVPFLFVGIAREFPTAPHDSFIVANAAYVAQATGRRRSDAAVRTTGSPPAVAAEVRTLLGPASGATVQDIVTQQRVTLPGLTALDLRVHPAGARLRAADGGRASRAGARARVRRAATDVRDRVGARRERRQLAAFVWSEAAFVAVGGARSAGSPAGASRTCS